MIDDLGAAVGLQQPATRIVSLVPSLTEAIAASHAERLVGATTWCSHPADLNVERVRGTKNPDVARIVDLQPDLVVANREENRRLDVERLRAAGVNVWVTEINTVAQALDSMTRLFTEGLGARPAWLTAAADAWTHQEPAAPSGDELRVAVAIWRDPWIWVGANTYANDVLHRLGLSNVFHPEVDLAQTLAHTPLPDRPPTDTTPARQALRTPPERYPHASVDDARVQSADLVLLPDEPYAFNPSDLSAFSPGRARLVSGRDLFWYGPAMIAAPRRLKRALQDSRTPSQSS